MQRLLTSFLTFAVVGGLATGVSAKPCRDAHGHFIKCAPAHSMMMAPKKKTCRDAHGRFMKCGMKM